MAKKYLLALDAGTSGGRCLIVTLEGELAGLAYQRWSYHMPEELAPLGREFDPAAFWQVICQLVRQALKEAGLSAADVVGVSATSQREGVIFLDKAGRELYAGPNIDLRALMEGLALDSQWGREIYEITGHRPSFLFAPARLRWFRNNRPEVYDKIARVLTISDWLVFRLCGEAVSEVSAAGEAGLLDIRRGLWSDRLIELLDLPKDVYPPLVRAGQRVGRVTARAARETGLAPGTPVAAGSADTQCGLLGMGVRCRGQVGIVAGWSTPLQMVLDELVIDGQQRLWSGCHLLPGRWVLESSAGECGRGYSWLKEKVFGDTADGYAKMDELALKTPSGADNTLAFLGPGVMDMSHLGPRLGGFLFPVPLSISEPDRGHLVRSALENLCFAIKANLGQLEEVAAAPATSISLGGGFSRSQALVDMLPQVLGYPVAVAKLAEVAGLGAALCAAVGAGVYPDLAQAAEAMVGPATIAEPDQSLVAEYVDHYERWLAAFRTLEKLSEGLS